MALQGNNTENGGILTSIEGRLLGLDAAGNLHLSTLLKMDAAPSRVIPGVVGRGIPFNFAISAAAGAANVSNVTFQLEDIGGNAISAVYEFDLYLSDSSVGNGLTATTASGGIAAVAASGTILGVLTTSKALKVVTNASGVFALAITDTSKTTFYPCAVLQGMPVQVGTRLTAANYG